MTKQVILQVYLSKDFSRAQKQSVTNTFILNLYSKKTSVLYVTATGPKNNSEVL